MCLSRKCYRLWRVCYTEVFEKYFDKKNLLNHIEIKLGELVRDLNGDPESIWRLLSEPIVARSGNMVFRRHRFYVRGVAYRAIYVVDVSNCTVVFLSATKRRETRETYSALFPIRMRENDIVKCIGP